MSLLNDPASVKDLTGTTGPVTDQVGRRYDGVEMSERGQAPTKSEPVPVR